MKKKVYILTFLLLLLTGCEEEKEPVITPTSEPTPTPTIMPTTTPTAKPTPSPTSTPKPTPTPTPEPAYVKKLKEKGYTNKEIETIRGKLSEKNINLITEHSYIEIITEIILNKNFKPENLKKYLDYYEKGMDATTVISNVHNNIEESSKEKLEAIKNHKYYISKNLERYMAYNSEDINKIITAVNTNIDRDFYTKIEKTDTSKGILLLCNKYYQLNKDYVYGNLVTISTEYSNKSDQKLNSVAYEAFKKLVDAGEKAGVHFRNLSAYRSYSRQSSLYNNYKKQNGLTWADKWSARPGHSEHQTGLALDVAVKGKSTFDNFEKTKEFKWLKDNAHLYGFVLRYPEGKEYITGYGYEPWHYRYVGIDAATYIYKNKITFEEYYAYYVEK